jgi:hypothetical protein
LRQAGRGGERGDGHGGYQFFHVDSSSGSIDLDAAKAESGRRCARQAAGDFSGCRKAGSAAHSIPRQNNGAGSKPPDGELLQHLEKPAKSINQAFGITFVATELFLERHEAIRIISNSEIIRRCGIAIRPKSPCTDT